MPSLSYDHAFARDVSRRHFPSVLYKCQKNANIYLAWASGGNPELLY
jgi:hypothetical protein